MILKTIERGIFVIELLSKHPKGLALVEISKKLGIPKSTVHHILSTYLHYDFVIQDEETKKYALGSKSFEISSRMLESFDIKAIAKKHLIQLHEKTGETVHLYVLRKGKIICVDKLSSPTGGGLSIASFIGWTIEPHTSAAGKVLISELSEEDILGIYPDRHLKAYVKNTITDFDELYQELKEVRRQGYAIDDEEHYEGVRCVGAPIRARGKIVASVSVSGSIFSMGMKKINQSFIASTVVAGEKISSEMASYHL